MASIKSSTLIMQWVALIFLLGAQGFLMWQGSHSAEGFGAYSPAIMGCFALIGLVVRSIFKTNTEDDQ